MGGKASPVGIRSMGSPTRRRCRGSGGGPSHRPFPDEMALVVLRTHMPRNRQHSHKQPVSKGTTNSIVPHTQTARQRASERSRQHRTRLPSCIYAHTAYAFRRFSLSVYLHSVRRARPFSPPAPLLRSDDAHTTLDGPSNLTTQKPAQLDTTDQVSQGHTTRPTGWWTPTHGPINPFALLFVCVSE